MTKIYSEKLFNALTSFIIILGVFFVSSSANAQANCVLTKSHGLGFTTSIKSVKDNGNNSYTIVLDF